MEWQPINQIVDNDDSTPLLILRRGIVVQASFFEGRLYPDARECCIDWDDGIIDATHYLPRAALPPPPEARP